MKGGEFFRKIKRIGRSRKAVVTFVQAHGKGSHGRLYYGERFTTLKDRKKEIGRGLLDSMCKDLGIDPEDL